MFGVTENTLWVEAFRPDTLDGYIGNEHIIDKVKIFIENGDVPHLLFSDRDWETYFNFFLLIQILQYL